MGFQLKNIQRTSKKVSKSFDIDVLLKKEIYVFGKSFSNKKKEHFYTELSVLLEAGLSLKDGLLLVSEEQKKERDKLLFTGIVEGIIVGKNFSEAIREHAEFSEYEYHSLKIGEETGTLQKVTKELGHFFKRKNEQRRTILNALSYPIVVLFTAFLAILFMLQFVVPMFANIFNQHKVELPWLTKIMIDASTIFQEFWWIFLLVVFGMFLFVRVFKKKEWYQKHYTCIVLKIPFIGEFIRTVKMAQFTQAITLLTGAKVPLLQGIQLTKKMMDYYPLEMALNAIEVSILQGKSLYESMRSQGIFDRKMVSLIKVAEETNQNNVIFKRLHYQYYQHITYQSKMISTTVEPFIILILGAIVAVILVAMYLPMFQLSTVIG